MKSTRAGATAARQQGNCENLVATRFKVRVPRSRRVTIAVPAEVEPGEAEVILLHRRAKPTPRKAPRSRGRQHPAFGLWASHPEVTEPVAFVADLRRRMMERRARPRETS